MGTLTLEPSRLFAEIDARPPLMRDEVMQMYIGRTVDWRLTFRNGSTNDRGQAWLIFNSQPNGVRMVTGTAQLSRYPGLRSLPSGETVRVRGRIRKMDSVCLDLDIDELELPTPAEAAHYSPRR